jgi:putative nucleotidyltransferase with HDIG domain
MGSAISIEDIVKKTTDLPTIPAAALEVMKMTGAQEANAVKIAGVLARDQSLSVRVLRLANSAFYGLSRQVTDLSEAVVVLGMRTVRNLSMVAATYPWMSRPLEGYALGPKQLWTHSFGTALGAQLTARISRKTTEDLAFTAGLLHDIGKVAISVWLENRIAMVMQYAQQKGLTFDQAEREILGYDHTQVGHFLAEEWNLPEEIALAIRHHHAPDGCPNNPAVVDCVHVGNYLTLAMGFGLGADGLRYEFQEAALDRLELGVESLDEVTDEFVEGYEKYETMFEELAAA